MANIGKTTNLSQQQEEKPLWKRPAAWVVTLLTSAVIYSGAARAGVNLPFGEMIRQAIQPRTESAALIVSTAIVPTKEPLGFDEMGCAAINFSQPIPFNPELAERNGITVQDGYATYPEGSDLNGMPAIITEEEAQAQVEQDSNIPFIGRLIANAFSSGTVYVNAGERPILVSISQVPTKGSELPKRAFINVIGIGERFYAGPIYRAGDGSTIDKTIAANMMAGLVVATDIQGNPVPPSFAQQCLAPVPDTNTGN